MIVEYRCKECGEIHYLTLPNLTEKERGDITITKCDDCVAIENRRKVAILKEDLDKLLLDPKNNAEEIKLFKSWIKEYRGI